MNWLKNFCCSEVTKQTIKNEKNFETTEENLTKTFQNTLTVNNKVNGKGKSRRAQFK